MRPCGHQHELIPGEPYQEGACRDCWLWFNDPEYRKIMEAPLQEPSLLQKGISFTKAVWQHASGGFPILSPEETRKRVEICEHCPGKYFNPANRHCVLCGCSMDWKASWAEQDCPQKYWPRIDPGKTI